MTLYNGLSFKKCMSRSFIYSVSNTVGLHITRTGAADERHVAAVAGLQSLGPVTKNSKAALTQYP